MSLIVGVLWEKDKDGLKYLSGHLHDLRGRIKIAVFPNNFKEKDKQPDYNIIISDLLDEKQSKKPAGKSRSKKAKDDLPM